LKGIRAVINNRKEISILAALQSGAKEHAEERNIGPHSGPNSGPKYRVINGGFPLFTTHLRAKYGAQIKQRKNGTHGSTRYGMSV
jgi:hypothetical protein